MKKLLASTIHRRRPLCALPVLPRRQSAAKSAMAEMNWASAGVAAHVDKYHPRKRLWLHRDAGYR